MVSLTLYSLSIGFPNILASDGFKVSGKEIIKSLKVNVTKRAFSNGLFAYISSLSNF